MLSKKIKKKGLHKNFSGDLQKKNVFQTNFQALYKILTIQKIVLFSNRGQANFQGLEASRPRPRTSKCVLEAKDVLEESTSDKYALKQQVIQSNFKSQKPYVFVILLLFRFVDICQQVFRLK